MNVVGAGAGIGGCVIVLCLTAAVACFVVTACSRRRAPTGRCERVENVVLNVAAAGEIREMNPMYNLQPAPARQQHHEPSPSKQQPQQQPKPQKQQPQQQQQQSVEAYPSQQQQYPSLQQQYPSSSSQQQPYPSQRYQQLSLTSPIAPQSQSVSSPVTRTPYDPAPIMSATITQSNMGMPTVQSFGNASAGSGSSSTSNAPFTQGYVGQ
jgi:hypothetical protein